MMDIVERLRTLETKLPATSDNWIEARELQQEAAAEIERLRAEIERMREALEPFASNFSHAEGRQGWPDNSPAGGLNFPVITNGHLRRAHAALSGKTEE